MPRIAMLNYIQQHISPFSLIQLDDSKSLSHYTTFFVTFIIFGRLRAKIKKYLAVIL